MNEKIFSLLGLARRAGKLATGHDAVIGAVVKNNAKLCIVCADASQRLKNELAHACNFENKNIALIESDFSAGEMSKAIGIKAAVVAVLDDGFSKRLSELFEADNR